jgi:integrase
MRPRDWAFDVARSKLKTVFTTSTGTPLAHSNFRRRVWLPALSAVGLEGVHIYDLRHTGNQLVANAGANPKEAIARVLRVAFDRCPDRDSNAGPTA